MFLGIDIGTSAVKALLVDGGERVASEAEIPLALSSPAPLWREQAPGDWWDAVDAAMRALGDQAPKALSAVRAVGLSGQMHGAVVLDDADRPLRPAILWNDGRAVAECAELEQAVPGLAEAAGVVAMPGFTAPKLLWLRNHEPRLFARIRTVLLPKDYIRLRLTGERATDMSDAAGTLWLDQASRRWNDAAVAASGLSTDQLPRLAEGTEVTGTIRPELARRWGLPDGVAVAGGGGDAACGGAGVGAIAEGDGFLSLGTSGQFFTATETYRPKPETLLHSFAHCVPGRWYQMAAMLNGASCLAWAAGLLGEPDIGTLLDRTEASYEGPSPVLFLPYLSGERTPHNDPHARGVLFGMDGETGPEDIVQAVLEGVAFGFGDAQACLAAAGTKCENPGVIGGGARSAFWTQILADVLAIPLIRYSGAEKGPALVAARLARIAATGETPETVCTKPVCEALIEPDPSRAEHYAEQAEKFRGLYTALRDEFRW